MTDRPDIQPGTRLERALVDVDARLDAVDMDLIRRIGGPAVATIPAPFLGHRAWAASVDVWDPAWPEDVRRRVIAAAPVVHRFKGTRFAVQKALDALGLKTVIQEWWQAGASPYVSRQPYTFHVTAFVTERWTQTGPLITPELTAAALSAVKAAKPHSRAFDVAIGVGTVRRLGGTSHARGLGMAGAQVPARPATGVGRDLGLAARGRATAVATLDVTARPDTSPDLCLGAAVRGRAVQLVTARMEARLG